MYSLFKNSNLRSVWWLMPRISAHKGQEDLLFDIILGKFKASLSYIAKFCYYKAMKEKLLNKINII